MVDARGARALPLDGAAQRVADADGEAPLVGVLALQGGFAAHARVLGTLGARIREVRVPADLDGLDGLVIPGGESTTMTLGIAREGLAEPLRALAAAPSGGRDGARATSGPSGISEVRGISGPGEISGTRATSVPDGISAPGGIPILGSCAGLIMLDRDHLGLMDMRARRNAFGRQIRSFEADVQMRGIEGPGRALRGVFIRAPWIAERGPDVEVLAELDGHPIAARQGNLLAVAFHAELTDDDRVHRLLLDAAAARGAARSA